MSKKLQETSSIAWQQTTLYMFQGGIHPSHIPSIRSLHGAKCLSDVSPEIAIHCLKSSRHFCNQFADHLLVLQLLVKVGGRWMECNWQQTNKHRCKDVTRNPSILKIKSEAARNQDQSLPHPKLLLDLRQWKIFQDTKAFGLFNKDPYIMVYYDPHIPG